MTTNEIPASAVTPTSSAATENTAASRPADSVTTAAGPHRRRAPARDARRLVPVVVPAMAAAIAGGVGLTRNGLTNGEAATMFAAHLTRHQFIHLIRHVDLVHSVYYASMHVVVVLGGGIVALRSVSLVATILAAALIGNLGRRLAGSTVSGTLAGLAYALSPVIDGLAKTARSYGILPLLVTLTVYAMLRALRITRTERPGRVRAWVLYGLLLLVTIYVHELSMLLVAGLAVMLLMLRTGRRGWSNAFLASAVAVVLASPLVYFSSRESKAVAWIKTPGVDSLLVVARAYSGKSNIALVVFAIGAVVAVVAGIRSWRAGPWSPDRRLMAVALPIAVVPPVLLIVESIVATPLFDPRYVTYYAPGAALLVGHGLATLGRYVTRAIVRPGSDTPARSRVLTVGAAVTGLVGLGVALVAQLPTERALTTPLGYYQDYGAAAHQVLSHARPGDGITYLPPNLHYLPDGYPALRKLDDVGLRVSPTAAGRYQGRAEPIGVTLAKLAKLRRVWVVAKVGKRWHTPNTDRQSNLLHSDFRRVRHWVDNGLVVSLWVNRVPAGHTS